MPIMAWCPHCGHVFPTRLIQAPEETFNSSTIEQNQEPCPKCHQTGTYGKSTGSYFWRDDPDVPNPSEPPAPAIDDHQAARSAVSGKLIPIEEAFLGRLTRGQPPETIFHYTTAEGLLGIVRSNRLWASDLLYMNDSTEVEYGRKLIIEVAAGVADEAKCSMAQMLCKSIDTVLYPVGMVSGGFYAACFCAEGDLLSQWRGYSGGVGGYALGFRSRDLQPIRASTPERRFVLRPIVYDPNQQRELIRTFLLEVDAALTELLDGDMVERESDVHTVAYVTIQRQMLECMLTMKNPAFMEEREWRLIHYRSGFSREPEATIEYRPTRSFIVPYVALDVTRMGPEVFEHVSANMQAEVRAHNRVPLSTVIIGPSAHPDAAAASIRTMLRDLHISADVINSKIPIRP
jgi:Protein of unknown function (DUF2971)